MGQDKKFKRYVTINETQMILQKLHEGFGGGHFAANIITKKIFYA
jgi:hypothetical protein